MMKIRPKDDRLSPNQVYMKNKWDALIKIADEAGFTPEAIEAAELCLMNLFDDVVEQCAKVAEEQAQIYSGEANESAGCYRAANAIRTYGKRLGNNE
jgi:hypothetical protein